MAIRYLMAQVLHLVIETARLNDVMADILVSYDGGEGLAEDSMETLVAHSTKVGLLSRVLLGIDELTTESLKLYSTEKSFQRLADLEVEHFKKIHKQANA